MIDVDPDLKRQLHAEVALEGRSLKEWFIERAEHFLAVRRATRITTVPDNSGDETESDAP